MKPTKKFATALLLVFALSLPLPQTLPMFGVPVTVEAATVKINKSKAVLTKGEKLKLKISGAKGKVKWKSSKPKIVSVNGKGLVKAKKKGTAKILATVNNKTYKCTVIVETPALNQNSVSLETGSTFQLSLTGTKRKISWTSDNESVASVDSNGLITAKGLGNCTVYAAIENSKFPCAVSVNAPVSDTQDSTYVWLSATGEKYHKIPNCGRMDPDKATKISLSEAISRGYVKCDKCF